jgi:hypothetical protein
MNNPLEILRTLDGHLTKPVELTLFGRSGLGLAIPTRPRITAPRWTWIPSVINN